MKLHDVQIFDRCLTNKELIYITGGNRYDYYKYIIKTQIMRTLSEIIQDIILKVAAFFAAIGVGIALLVTAAIMTPFYYWRITMVVAIVIAGVMAYVNIITNSYSFVL